ncbi:MAG TPA: CoA transferase subunit A [Anaerolineaceae bacterium]|nr:MAG: glutaconate CoA-transferase [Chloroflexi bacterium GWB2_54_36]HAL16992.1 CoA transferase subunit A [Anaerolineaceae bacterium]
MIELEGDIQPVGELFQSPDVNAAREFFRHKSRAMVDKRMGVREAVERFIHDGDYIATGGFGSVRFSTAVLHEIVRTRKHNLGFSGHSTTHDFQILAAGRVIDRCDIAYVVGLEIRGLSPNGRRFMESGAVRTTEWSNAGLGWRYKAAAMGVPFLPARVMLGSDTLRYSAGRLIEDPFTGQKLLAVPALYPDIGIIHVHQADIYGNAQIDGTSIVDLDLAKASKRLIVTTERMVETEEFRRDPRKTSIPYWQVDAVCHVPFGSYPGNMPFEYFSDERHLAEWVEVEQDEARFAAFLDKFIYGVDNFETYLALAAGEQRLAELRSLEILKRS